MKIDKRDLAGAVIILCLLAIIAYVIARTTLFLIAEYAPIEKFFAVLLIFGEFFVIIHGFGYVLNIFKVFRMEKIRKIAYNMPEIEPSVAVLVAARHEPKNILENTFITLNNINYKNKEIYFLDDSSDDNYRSEASDIAKEYNLKLFRRRGRHGAKAGIINDCLKTLTHEYIAVFDADQNPLPEFLHTLIPIMENDKKLSFVQTPQFYTNIEESRVARASAFQQDIFYEYICEGKSARDAMFCCGTNLVFRRDALEDVGGMDESTVTEDFATSIKMHSHGWKSLYYDHVCAFGMGPENLMGYFRQQFRWTAGTLAVFKKLIWRFLTRPFSLKLNQWWEYFLASSYYLIGIAFFILMSCPVIYLLFKVPSFFAKPEIYFLAFLPYIMLTMGIFYTILKLRNYKIKDLFLGQLLGFVTFSVYIRGAASALLGIKVKFGITEKTRTKALPYIKLWPQLSMIFANLLALVWGMNRFYYERNPALLVNCVWVLYHFLILSSIFYFNRENDRFYER